MNTLGYSSVEELIKKEDIYRLFALARYLAPLEWKDAMFKEFRALHSVDFVKREIQFRFFDAQTYRIWP